MAEFLDCSKYYQKFKFLLPFWSICTVHVACRVGKQSSKVVNFFFLITCASVEKLSVVLTLLKSVLNQSYFICTGKAIKWFLKLGSMRASVSCREVKSYLWKRIFITQTISDLGLLFSEPVCFLFSVTLSEVFEPSPVSSACYQSVNNSNFCGLCSPERQESFTWKHYYRNPGIQISRW